MVAKRRLSEENLTRVTGLAGRHCHTQSISNGGGTLVPELSCSSKKNSTGGPQVLPDVWSAICHI